MYSIRREFFKRKCNFNFKIKHFYRIFLTISLFCYSVCGLLWRNYFYCFSFICSCPPTVGQAFAFALEIAFEFGKTTIVTLLQNAVQWFLTLFRGWFYFLRQYFFQKDNHYLHKNQRLCLPLLLPK